MPPTPTAGPAAVSSRGFLAQEVRLRRTVVVKVLPPQMAAGVSVDRFEREIQLAAKLLVKDDHIETRGAGEFDRLPEVRQRSTVWPACSPNSLSASPASAWLATRTRGGWVRWGVGVGAWG